MICLIKLPKKYDKVSLHIRKESFINGEKTILSLKWWWDLNGINVFQWLQCYCINIIICKKWKIVS